MAKFTKKEADYSRGMIHSHCGKVFPNDNGHCQHFKGHADVTALGTCTKTEGEINPVYWCKEFEKAKK